MNANASGQAPTGVRPGLIDEYWYYSVEVEAGLFTSGMLYGNVALTRKLLRQIDVMGARCVDLGTMEAVVPTLLKKRGASEVVAIDAMNNSEKVDFVKRLHGVSFQYQSNTPVDQTVGFLRRKARIEVNSRSSEDWRYDLTVASGLLYHFAAPLPLIGYLRTMTRIGGLVIIETAALNRPEYDMRYCFDGEKYIYGWSDTWFPSIPLLDHLLRTCRLQPLDLAYLDQSDIYPGLVRVAVVCRATEDVIDAGREVHMPQSAHNVDFAVSMDLECDYGGPPVAFEPRREGLMERDGVGGCDMYATVNARRPHVPSENEIRLLLNALD